MNKKVIGALGLAIILFTASPGFASLASLAHKYIMRGQILEMNGNTAYLCIGSADGAKVGQVLNVFKFTKTSAFTPKTTIMYRRDEVGEIKITKIVDVHMAYAKVISGEASQNDVVELK